MNPWTRTLLATSIASSFAIGAAAPATAAQWVFSQSFTTGFAGSFAEVLASGVLTTSDIANGDGSFTITGITGTRTFNSMTNTITGLVDIGGFGGNDNKLFTTGGALLNGNGLSYAINGNNNGDGGNLVNVYFHNSTRGYTELAQSVGYGTFTISPVPEPATWALMLGGLGVLAWSRRRQATAGA